MRWIRDVDFSGTECVLDPDGYEYNAPGGPGYEVTVSGRPSPIKGCRIDVSAANIDKTTLWGTVALHPRPQAVAKATVLHMGSLAPHGDPVIIFPNIREPGGDSDVFLLE